MAKTKNFLPKCTSLSNRQRLVTLVVLAFVGLLPKHFSCTAGSSVPVAAIESYFSPEDRCIEAIVARIQAARKTILVEAYVITDAEIVDALIEAHQRQIYVHLLVDKGALTSHGTKIPRIRQAGIPITVDLVPGLAHNKVMLMDGEYVITGSFNWTKSAQTRNAENVLIIKHSKVAKRFIQEWKKRANKGKKINH